MSHIETNESVNGYIEQIVQNHSTIVDAMKALKHKFPFMNDETLYNVIMDLLKYNKHLSLIDNFKDIFSESNSSMNESSINNATENIIMEFEPYEIEKLQETLVINDEKESTIDAVDINKNTINYKMDWMKICECVSHEMWPALSSRIKSIIRENNINICQINADNIKIITDALKKRTIA
eukprot:361480_1